MILDPLQQQPAGCSLPGRQAQSEGGVAGGAFIIATKAQGLSRQLGCQGRAGG